MSINYDFNSYSYEIEMQNNKLQIKELDHTKSPGHRIGATISQLKECIYRNSFSKNDIEKLQPFLSAFEGRVKRAIREKHTYIGKIIIWAQEAFGVGKLTEIKKLQTALAHPGDVADKVALVGKRFQQEVAKPVQNEPPKVVAKPVVPAPIPIKTPVVAAVLAPRKGVPCDVLAAQIRHAFQNPAALRALFEVAPKEDLGAAVRLLFKEGMSLENKLLLRRFLSEQYKGAHNKYFEYQTGHVPKEAGQKPKPDFLERYFTPEGVADIVAFLKEKPKNPIALPCTVCPDFADFTASLKAIKDDPRIALPQTFILRCYKEDSYKGNVLSKHMTPLYVYRTDEGKIRILSTDSTGGWRSLNNSFKKLAEGKDFKNKIEIFRFESAPPTTPRPKDAEKLKAWEAARDRDMQLHFRQKDEHNCSIFSIHDVTIFSKTHARLHGLLEKAVPPKKSKGFAPIPVEALPLAFMLPTQSTAAIQGYVAKHAKQLEPQEPAELDKNLQRYLVTVEVRNDKQEKVLKKQNHYAERRGDKFEGMLWERIIATG